MIKYLFILGVFISCQALAQSNTHKETEQASIEEMEEDTESPENDILKCDKYREGVYRSFEEFRRNDPFITQEFVFFKSNTPSSKPYLEHEKNQLQLVDEDGNTSKVLDRVWGLCDASGVYLYFEDTYQLGKRYNLITHIGQYCYFVDEYDMHEPSTGNNKTGIPTTKHIRIEYVLNINNGQVSELSVMALRKILSQDQELLGKFEKEKTPGAVKYDYLVLFNERNEKSVKPLKY
ncbi:MAG: hypothetical protein V4714_07190 [Bacteroidota bacterium]